MKKHFSLIALIIIIALIGVGIFTYFPQPYQYWTKLNTTVTQAAVNEKEKSPWRATPVQISRGVFDGSYFFYDENIIYGVSFGKPSSVYRTSDGGKNWEKRSTMPDSDINSIVFISPTEGFLLLSATGDGGGKNLVLQTEDGGANWKTIYTSNGAGLYDLNINANGTGILNGRRESAAASANVVLITADKGKTWTDVSENLNRRKELTGVRDVLTGTIISDDKGIVALTDTGKLFNTNNQGKSWNLLALLADKEPQIGFSHLGKLASGKFWIAGGTTSIEGKWSEIAVTNKLGWNRYKLNNYYFNDVAFLSNDEVIACGSAFKMDNSSNITKELTAAVVMYSANAGKDWETVYVNEAEWKPVDPKKGLPGFYEIYKISKDKVLVRGENGIDLILDRISKSAGN